MKKRSLVLNGHRTSVALEPEFWAELERIAKQRDLSLSALVAGLDAVREAANLASALRLMVLADLKRRTLEDPDQ
ncbi:MAG: ribbon-helix-helix domain-containing protein [Hyphomicrobiaceae bacterium]|nr:ribbon-helix-helix domain-containing protein [Hyphomicrobiaceae bacterium]